MIFEFGESCFRDPVNTGALIVMSQIALKGRHRLYVKDPEDMLYLTWLNTLTRDLAGSWCLLLDESVKLEALEPATVTVNVCEVAPVNHDTKKLSLKINQAERLIREPFRIYVENDGADRDFLLTYANANQMKKIRDLEKENLLSFEHCGGIGELPKKIDNYVKIDELNAINCVAVFDSDAPQPLSVSSDAIAAKEKCNELGLPAFMLKRRAIENYLMISWLNTWLAKLSHAQRKKTLPLFNSFCALQKDQRSHFHMKKGLKIDQEKIDDQSVTLYAGVSDGDMKNLKHGFGKSLAADLFSADWVQSVQSVDDLDAWQEVNGFVNEILVLCR